MRERGGMAHKWWECIPRPKRNHEPQPGEKEDTAVGIDWIEDWHASRLFVDGVEHWRAPEIRELEAHGTGLVA